MILFSILIGPATLCALCDRLRAAGWVGPLVGAAIGAGIGFLFWLGWPTVAGEFQAVQCHAAWLGAGLAATLLRWIWPR